MKKLLVVLCAWFLLEWFYTTKLKPFIVSEFFTPKPETTTPDTTGNDRSPITQTDISRDSGIMLKLPGLPLRKYVYGLDISHYNGDEADFLKRRTDSVAFVICKATEGVNTKDSYFASNWNLLKQKHIIRGAYHFYHCTSDPVQQANFFLSVMGPLNKTDFPPVADIEATSFSSSCSVKEAQQNILKFLNIIEDSTGRIPVIYTGYSVGNEWMNNSAFSRYPLWIANYNKIESPPVPDAWAGSGWVIWQQSETYELHGQANDFDVFNGGILALRKFIQQH